LVGQGITFDKAGNIYIAGEDAIASGVLIKPRIRKVDIATGIITSIAGGGNTLGDGGDAIYCDIRPMRLAFDHDGDLLATDYFNMRVRKITNVTTGVTNINPLYDISLYPSPNHGTFTIDLSSLTIQQANITIMNIAGQRVKELTATTGKPLQMTIDVPAGVYFVIATINESKYCKKLVIN